MIWHPKPGQRVRLHYAHSFLPFHGQCGAVILSGGRPCNVLVLLDSGVRLIVPRGNLVKEETWNSSWISALVAKTKRRDSRATWQNVAESGVF